MIGTFLRKNNSTKKIMMHLLIALAPIIIFNVYKNGYIPYSNGKTDFIGLIYPLLFVLIGALTTFAVELLYAIINKKNLKNYMQNSYSIFPGLFLALILPINCPISVLIIGCLVATILGKLVFGGFGNNIFNPALLGYLFIIIAYPMVFTTNNYLNSYEIDTISHATPLTNASMVEGIGTYDELIKPYGDLTDFAIGLIPGSQGEVSAVLCLFALVYLTITGVIKWKIPLFYIGTVFVLTFIISQILDIGIYYPIFHLLSGGLMFGSIFMATDPVTSPVTSIGQILFGIFLGILTVILRFNGIEGVAISILTMNMFVFILDKIGSKSKFDFSKSIIPFIISVILILVVAFSLSKKGTDSDFNIISKNKTNNITTYVATQKGYGGLIKAEVIIENDRVTKYTVLEENESEINFGYVMDADYLNTLIKNQNKINEVDTVSSATISSKALKKLLINVMEDYK